MLFACSGQFVMNYTDTEVPGFWEQLTRNIRDISNAVVVSLFTKASPWPS